eukprot:CAMPEP_0195519044 /NCGR_PEP_ID=MMETSP0794_2-20130614/14254_1 /TAXON_ID=515487 /ORGANISM="Stephanopyxis turris, Strain CCMP 815" /LENGTH=306 /DNA_ID=CAMNT_0040648127 /DNA_START=116 /DNA_END=1033 /DNA_ORIENTATION=+
MMNLKNMLFMIVITSVSIECLSLTPALTHLNQRSSFLPSGGGVTKNSPLVGSVDDFNRQNLNARRQNLNMVAASPLPVKVGVAAITGAITGGFFAGGLHAVAGPDHLAALLPKCCGQRWYKAGRVGALWGLGHGISATLLGILGYALKSRLHNVSSMKWLLNGASKGTEIAIGASLVLIGLLGIKEAREWESELEGVTAVSLSAAAPDDSGVKMQKNRSVIFNGLLHGFSWDGAPSLAPALAVASWRGNLTFLLAYAAGTMATMAVTTTLIGEGTRNLGEIMNRPDIPQKLSFVSSLVAMIVGVVW